MRSAITVAALLAAVVVLPACGGTNSNWYTAGKAFDRADDKLTGNALLVGSAGILAKWCRLSLNAASLPVSADRPSGRSGAAAQQWIQGCEAGYRADHPDQLVENGIMYARNTVRCTDSCESHWYAVGRALAVFASQSSGVYFPDAQGGLQWCADLVFPPAPLPANVEAQVEAHLPPGGPAYLNFDKGCIAGYNSMDASESDPSPAPSPTAPPLSLTCTLEYNVPEQDAIGNSDSSTWGWVPAIDNNGSGPARKWSGTFTKGAPNGWVQGAGIGATVTGDEAYEEPATKYPIIIVFRDAGGTIIYTTATTVRISGADYGGVYVNVAVGISATGADRCAASQGVP